MKKLFPRQCIDCYHLSDPFHVYNEDGIHHYEDPHKSWWQTWHYGDDKHGEGPHYYFVDVSFPKALYRYLTRGRKQRNKYIKHLRKSR